MSEIKLKVVCNACCFNYEWEDVTLAKHPLFRPREENLLVCHPVPAPNPQPGGTVAFCDDCKCLVAIAPSSKWLLDLAGRDYGPDAGLNSSDPRWHWWQERPRP